MVDIKKTAQDLGGKAKEKGKDTASKAKEKAKDIKENL
jgi:hypothetical protein